MITVQENKYENTYNHKMSIICYPHMLMGMAGIYRLLFLCLQNSYNGYIWRGLTQGDEILQDDRPGW